MPMTSAQGDQVIELLTEIRDLFKELRDSAGDCGHGDDDE